MTMTHPVTLFSSAATGGNETVFPSRQDYAVFDGVDDYVSIPNSSDFSLTTTISVSAWVNVSTISSGERGIVVKAFSSSVPFDLRINTSDKFRFGFFDGSWKTVESAAVSEGQWYFIVGTYNSATGKLAVIVNGTESSTTTSGSLPTNSAILQIGRYDASNRFKGSLRDVRIYDDVLTSDEITYLYTSGASGTDPTNTNLVGHWKFDEREGSLIADSSGNGNDGTATNITEPAFWNRYATFDGVDDYVDVGDVLNFGASDDFSVCTWFKTTDDNGHMVDKVGASASKFYYLGIFGSKIQFSLKGSNTITYTTSANYNDNAWHNVVCVRDAGSNVLMYIDGSLIGSTGSDSSGDLSNTGSLEIGMTHWNIPNQYPFNGSLRDVRIYNKALTSGEVTYLYTAGASGTDPTTTNLVGRWKLDDGDGAVVADSSGNGNDGVATNITLPTFWNWHYGNFDGVNDYVTIPDASSLKPSNITMSLWIYRNSLVGNWDFMIGKTTSSWWNDGYGLTGTTGAGTALRFWVNNYNIAHPSTVVSTGTWVHLVGTYDGSSVKLYRDGALLGSFSYSTPIAHSTMPLQLGSQSGSYPTASKMADVRIYDKALSASEVEWLYTGGASGADPTGTNLKAHYKFDEGSGTTVGDSSGTGNTGTATNITPAAFWGF